MNNCVYFFMSYTREILYIGKAKDLKQRLLNHNHLDLDCYVDTSFIAYVEFDTEFDAETIEKICIAKYKPQYNKTYSDKNTGIVIEDKLSNLKFIFAIDYEGLDKEFHKKYIDFVVHKINKSKNKFYTKNYLCGKFLHPKYNCANENCLEMMYLYGIEEIISDPGKCAERYLNHYIEKSAQELEEKMIKLGYIDMDDLEEYALFGVYEINRFESEVDESDMGIREHYRWYLYLSTKTPNDEIGLQVDKKFFYGKEMDKVIEIVKNLILDKLSEKYNFKNALIPE